LLCGLFGEDARPTQPYLEDRATDPASREAPKGRILRPRQPVSLSGAASSGKGRDQKKCQTVQILALIGVEFKRAKTGSDPPGASCVLNTRLLETRTRVSGYLVRLKRTLC
jgi:hypothetical protein